jgi:hypothetical protein
MVLGELLVEERGRITGRRLLSIDDGSAKVEVTFQTTGALGDVEFADLGTYVSAARPDGTLTGETQGAMRTPNGDFALWRGVTEGRFSDDGALRHYQGAVVTQDASGPLARLRGVVGVFEIEIDHDGGQITRRVWEVNSEHPRTTT